MIEIFLDAPMELKVLLLGFMFLLIKEALKEYKNK
tara:strand:+ start:285 stop:389 length:105 start_codon:yes stop_codon:yes gene_type:complete